jgi:hypothetical protein
LATARVGAQRSAAAAAASNGTDLAHAPTCGRALGRRVLAQACGPVVRATIERERSRRGR